MKGQFRPLVEILSEIPDLRKAKGKRHPLSAILILACVAMLCGYKTYRAFAEWGYNYGYELLTAMGFTYNKPPCPATFLNVFRKIDIKLFEEKVGQWAESIIDETDRALAIDGKTLRATTKQCGRLYHLLSAVSHTLGLTLAQCNVSSKTNEMTAIRDIIKGLVLDGKIITVDALLTQRDISKDILEAGGDYVMIVKDNQKALLDDVKTVFDGPFSSFLRKWSAKTIDSIHGRIEERFLLSSDELVGYSDWPGLNQVFELTRTTVIKKTGEVRKEQVYGITSLTHEQADPLRLLSLVRSHWHIENKSHWVRDVIFDEDRNTVRTDSVPELMSSIRNLVIGLMRYSGVTNIASACRKFAAQPELALKLVGIKMEN